jgi:hypothetical protein
MLSDGEAPAGPVVIGWKEYVDLPDLGIRRLKAKVDTGARTSSLHVRDLTVIGHHDDGTADVEFAVPLSRRHPDRSLRTRARMLRQVRVVDSGGNAEVRPLIETLLVLGPVRKRVLLTLTDRTGMLFRILIGRKALEGDFLVDVAGKYLQREWHPLPPRPRRGVETAP